MQPQLRIDNTTPLAPMDNIVHLGAGRCSELNDYLARQPLHLLLVEADPYLAENLQNRTKNLELVQVICAAIAGRPGPATFNRYNLNKANSLHCASELIELFPGLKTLEQLKVDAISPDSLLDPLALKITQNNLLVIDIPGEEMSVLQTLKNSKKLFLFSQINLHCGCRGLYEESEPAARVLDWLRVEGFDLISRDDGVDMDLPCWTLRRNDRALQNREIINQINLSAKKFQTLENKTFSIITTIENLMIELDAQKSLVTDMAIKKDDIENGNKGEDSYESSLKTKIKKLAEDCDKKNDIIVELSDLVAQITQKNKKLSRRIDAKQKKNNSLNEQMSDLQIQLQEYKKENNASNEHRKDRPSAQSTESDFIQVEKYIAFNASYRNEWKTYLQGLSQSEFRAHFTKLSLGLDAESLELISTHLDLIRMFYSNKLLNYLYVKANPKKDLLPKKTLKHFDRIGFYENHEDLLNNLQKKLQLPETPLKEAFFHCGLTYIPRIAKAKIKDSSIIDAGAYIGDTARLFLEFYNPSRIYAFEPHPDSYKKLCESVDKWELTNTIETVECATGYKKGKTKLWGDGIGASLIKKTTNSSSSPFHVRVINIDSFVEEHGINNISLIKLDVEGSELQTIKGSTKTIKKYKPIILASIYHTAKDFFEVKPYIESLNLGYKFMVRRVSDDLIKELILIAYID